MNPGLSEVAAEVESDPGAVFEAHGAESVRELVESGGSGGAAPGASGSLVRLFEGDLDRPERREVPDDEEERRETGPTPAMLADLERAIDAEEPDEAADELSSLDDGDVADALAAADELEEGDLPASVPEEWLEDA